jgi:4-methyl-5(b-hydroxyethyl)-thiazole monophosphate biosynthesis
MPTTLIPLAEGFEELEAVTIIDVLRRGQVTVTVAGLTDKVVTGSHQISIVADCLLNDVLDHTYDLIVLPGGPGTRNLRADQRIQTLLQKQAQADRLIAAICAAPVVLSDAGLLKEKQATIYPRLGFELQIAQVKEEEVVVDGKIITGKSPQAAYGFALQLLAILQGSAMEAEVRQKMAGN